MFAANDGEPEPIVIGGGRVRSFEHEGGRIRTAEWAGRIVPRHDGIVCDGIIEESCSIEYHRRKAHGKPLFGHGGED